MVLKHASVDTDQCTFTFQKHDARIILLGAYEDKGLKVFCQVCVQDISNVWDIYSCNVPKCSFKGTQHAAQWSYDGSNIFKMN